MCQKTDMNDLEKYFNNNSIRLIHKWQHYFEIYDRYFHSFRNKEIHLLEFGVSHGGSLQMWKHYFGEKAKIYGVDINPACKALEEEGIEIFIGSQEDRKFLQELKIKIPPIDILIDDGGHSMKQQIYTFEEMYDHVRQNGIYLCEDTHTSYWKDFGGGFQRKGTFLEYSKNLIDQLYAWHSEQKNRFSVTSFTQSAFSLHFYNSIVVIEKRPMTESFEVKTGNPVVECYRPKVPKLKKLFSKLWKNLKIV